MCISFVNDHTYAQTFSHIESKRKEEEEGKSNSSVTEIKDV